jgi:metallo-beta-lactamase class B
MMIKGDSDMLGFLTASLLVIAAGQAGAAEISDDPLTKPIAEEYAKRKWLRPIPPVRIFGNTYSVGFEGLSVTLIYTDKGLILIDAALPQSVPALENNIRSLGFKLSDIKYILSTEPHYDHAGGLAALVRDTGAQVIASKSAAEVLQSGRAGPDDPQYAELPEFPRITDVRQMRDGQTLRLGETIITAIATPGHTAGSMSWTWRSCEGESCKTVVFGSSLNPVSDDHYHFGAKANRKATNRFRVTIARMRKLPCDILITAHPAQSGGDVKFRALLTNPTPNPFVDHSACRSYADRHEQLLNERIAKESGERR